MKISVAIQHFNRKNLLLNTLNSIQKTSLDKKDIEIIIVDDASNPEHQVDNLSLLYPDLNLKIFSFSREEKWWGCPVIPLNKGIAMATGDVVVLLCAECMFVGDILLDIKNRIKNNDYLVYATLSLTPEDSIKLSNMSYDQILTDRFLPNNSSGMTGGWYQHSVFRNSCFNFCSAITRKDLLELGGFDERFGWGTSHGDDDFLLRVRKKGMNVIPVDDPMTYHQYHPTMISPSPSNNLKDNNLFEITRNESGFKVKNSFKKNMKIIYRISDVGYKKTKPDYINNENCLKNALLTFPPYEYDWSIIADNISEETNNMIQKYISRDHIYYVSIGHGAGTFNLALDEALQNPDDEIIYFLENDYLHKPGSDQIIKEGFSLGASFIALYDHPDKYLDPARGGNPYCEGGAEDTRVYLTDSCHWKITNSTTMTFASKVSTLKRVESILRMFLELRENNELLITPIPGYSTHGETAWLSPLTDWSKI